jgi:hydroxyacylglutathione hydrolase
MIQKEIVFIGEYKITVITSGKLEQNCFMVKHIPSSDLILIDPGQATREILEEIEEEGSKLKIVLLTHAHFDHVSGLKTICEHFDLPFWFHRADMKLLRRAPIYAISMEKRVLEISTNYKFIEGPIAEWGGETIYVINTPGHTPGSVCFHFGNMLFSGDIILTEQKIKLELPGYNNIELLESITHILYDLPGETVFFPGHGKIETINKIKLWWESNGKPVENI